MDFCVSSSWGSAIILYVAEPYGIDGEEYVRAGAPARNLIIAASISFIDNGATDFAEQLRPSVAASRIIIMTVTSGASTFTLSSLFAVGAQPPDMQWLCNAMFNGMPGLPVSTLIIQSIVVNQD